jgi:hypothetical protein
MGTRIARVWATFGARSDDGRAQSLDSRLHIRVGSAQDWTSEVATDSSQTKARDDIGRPPRVVTAIFFMEK